MVRGKAPMENNRDLRIGELDGTEEVGGKGRNFRSRARGIVGEKVTFVR